MLSLQQVKAAILAILASFALVVSNGVHKIPDDVELTLNGNLAKYVWKLRAAFEPASYYVLFFVLMAFFAFSYLLPKINKKHLAWSIPFSVISALILLLCDSYYATNSWDNVFGSWEALITSLIKGTGIAILVFFIYDVINRISVERADNNRCPTSSFRSYVISFAVMLLCWIPYMVIMAPGNMNPDARDQFGQILNNPDMCWSVDTVVRGAHDSLLTNHHPVFHTVILGCFLKLGELLGSYFVGITIYSILQCMFFVAVLVFTVVKLREYGMSKRVCRIVYWCFALCPIFPLWGMTILKDTPFTITLMLVTILLYEVFRSPESFPVKKYVLLSALLFVLMLFRNNGFYMILMLVPFVVIAYRRSRHNLLKLVVMLLIPLAVFKIGYSGVLFQVMHINEGSPREMLSVPFQQTARYIVEHEEEITPEEEQSITTILGGGKLSLTDIAETYTPDRADSVKWTYNKYATSEDLKQYFATWIEQFLQHPDVYLEAFFNLDYAWFSFDSNHDLIYYNGVSDSLIPHYVEGLDNPESTDTARSILSQVINLLDKIPVFSSFFELSTYTWLYIVFFLAMLMRKKYRELLACLPIFLNMAICFIGPVAYMRYAIPLVACLPLVFFLTFSKARSQTETTDEKMSVIWIR